MPAERQDSTLGHTPLTHLGHSTGRNYLNEAELLIAMKCYFDGSNGTGSDGDSWMTLGGAATSDTLWNSFNERWDDMLKDRYPRAFWVSMNPLFSGEDPFERVNGWTDEKREDLMRDSLEILVSMDKRMFRTFVCSINLSARDRLIAEGCAVPDPVTLCVEMCVGSFVQWTNERKLEFNYLFFDRGEAFYTEFHSRWLKERTPPGTITPNGSSIFWDMIANVQEVDMKTTPPIQVADVLAWARTRSFSTKTASHLDSLLRAVVPSTSLLVTEDMMRERALRLQHEA